MSVTTDAHPTITSTNVLIVDDHDLVAMSLALCLRSEGMHAQRHAARSRDGILTAVATLVPGVVLLDLDLGRGPDGEPIDGTTLVAGLCRNGWRVIVLSATTDDARIGRALNAGALACVPKTAALPVLITAIRRATQGMQVMHPERRQYYVMKYQQQQEQAQVVERRLARLTDRERAVLEQLARGRRAQSIAEEFRVSLATTRTQIRAVLQKLEVNGQLEAVALLNDYRRATRGE
jgi:two-component system, NarL family, response regulator LiaR